MLTLAELEQFEMQARRLARQHQDALLLLGEIVATLRNPSNVQRVAAKLPEAEPVIASWCERYRREFEKSGEVKRA